jgi:hypothetical protein
MPDSKRFEVACLHGVPIRHRTGDGQDGVHTVECQPEMFELEL